MCLFFLKSVSAVISLVQLVAQHVCCSCLLFSVLHVCVGLCVLCSLSHPPVAFKRFISSPVLGTGSPTLASLSGSFFAAACCSSSAMSLLLSFAWTMSSTRQTQTNAGITLTTKTVTTIRCWLEETQCEV